MSEPFSLLRAAGVALVLSGAVAWMGLKLANPSDSVEPGMPTFGDFEVRSGTESVRLSDFAGSVVVVYFGYAGCPDICPTTLSTVGAALRLLSPEQLARTRGLFVSVDPERDTPAQARSYAAFFHERIVGATTDVQAVTSIAEDWGVRFEKAEGASEAMGYTVDHTSIVFLVAPDGRMKKALPHGSDPEKLAAAIVDVMGAAGTPER